MSPATHRRATPIAALAILIALGIAIGSTTDIGISTALLVEGGGLLVVAAVIGVSGRLRR